MTTLDQLTLQQSGANRTAGKSTLFMFLKNKKQIKKPIHLLSDFCFNPEKDLKTKCVVEMEGNQTILHPAVASVNKGDPR